MAIYHSTVKTFSRAKGHSSLAAAAYRAAMLIIDKRTGVRHDYRRKRGVVETVVFTPGPAPDWALSLQDLWAAAEEAETRRNATVAREFELALPHELNDNQRKDLVQDIAYALVARYEFAVQASTHMPSDGGLNHHVHFLVTTRRLTEDGLGDKTRELDGGPSGSMEVRWTREMMAALINDHLARAKIDAQVDQRTLEVQAEEAWERGDEEGAIALTRRPVRTLSKNAIALERKGISTEIGRENKKIKADNARRVEKALALLAETKHPSPHWQELRRRQRKRRRDLQIFTTDLVIGDIAGTGNSEVFNMLGAAPSTEDDKPVAEEAWSQAQVLWHQHILPALAAAMPTTTQLMNGMTERVRRYMHDNALADAVKELLRRFKVLKRHIDLPEAKAKTYQRACDLLDRAQWALQQVNRLNPTGRDIVRRHRRKQWAKHNEQSVAIALAALHPDIIRQDNERKDIASAEVELWSLHMMKRFPLDHLDEAVSHAAAQFSEDDAPPALNLEFPPPGTGGPK